MFFSRFLILPGLDATCDSWQFHGCYHVIPYDNLMPFPCIELHGIIQLYAWDRWQSNDSMNGIVWNHMMLWVKPSDARDTIVRMRLNLQFWKMWERTPMGFKNAMSPTRNIKKWLFPNLSWKLFSSKKSNSAEKAVIFPQLLRKLSSVPRDQKND